MNALYGNSSVAVSRNKPVGIGKVKVAERQIKMNRRADLGGGSDSENVGGEIVQPNRVCYVYVKKDMLANGANGVNKANLVKGNSVEKVVKSENFDGEGRLDVREGDNILNQGVNHDNNIHSGSIGGSIGESIRGSVGGVDRVRY